jgi:EmrB/QacA subfamily drug resistance transporter
MSASVSTAQPNQRRWWAFGVLCLSLLVVVLDNTILNVALPTLARDLSATGSQLQWIVDSYVLIFAGLLLTSGSIGDRFGRKGALFAGMAIFAAGSIWAALAGSADMLIAARALMGVGGALMMPPTLSITTNMFDAEERAKAIGIWAGVAGLGIVLGPLAGGWLLKYFSWGAVFLVNLPLIAVALVAGFFLLPDSRDPEATPLDPVGALLSIAGLVALLYGIIEVPIHGWTDRTILTSFGLAAILLAAFVGWELRTAHPMLDMRLFRNARFSAASLALALVTFSLFGTLFFLTQYLQLILGYTALEAGVRFAPLAVGLGLGAGVSTRLMKRFGAKLPVGLGLLIVGAALALLALVDVGSDYWLVAAVIVTLGFGMGNVMPPATDSIMGALPLAQAGVGSAMNDTTRQVGGALGVAVLGSLLSAAYRGTLDGAQATQALPGPLRDLARDSLAQATAVATQLGGEPGAALLATAQGAFVDAMGRSALVAAGVALLGAVVALAFLPARVAETEETSAALPGHGTAPLHATEQG